MPCLAAPGASPTADVSTIDIEPALREVWPRAVRTAYGVLGSMPAAQDVVQDACIVAYRKRGMLRDATAFDTWFLTIVVRRAYAVSRKHKRPDAALFACAEPEISSVVDVRRALDALAPKLRIAIVLCDILLYTSDEVAHLLGVPSATVRNRVFRGRRILAQTLCDYAPENRDGK